MIEKIKAFLSIAKENLSKCDPYDFQEYNYWLGKIKAYEDLLELVEKF